MADFQEEPTGNDRGNPGSQPEGDTQRTQKYQGTSPLEWVFAAVSALLVLGAIATIAYEGFTQEDRPPDITIMVEAVQKVQGGYLVQFQARNVGYSTAANLVIDGALKKGDQTIEESSVTIDFISPEGFESGGLFFTHDPDSFTLEINPKGYNVP